ncbi:DUF2034 domain-containing protein [Deinococcus sp. HMF7620]|uniref:DUF2034 domain-containing protein n=1 Tax=Deinococcus arboris TaxID=2682977 RepID=A0A7C9MPG4_9DEIO|nr:restriction endonuclease [Deinococcus arboris]MVN85544.1 DUF2034 domain-containing protein [Deinococcus arboris]
MMKKGAPGGSEMLLKGRVDTELLVALEQVMQTTSGYQEVADVVRRLESTGHPYRAQQVIENILAEREMRARRGQQQRFGIGRVGRLYRLSWLGQPAQTKSSPSRHNSEAAVPRAGYSKAERACLKRLRAMNWQDFEAQIEQLLPALGMQNVVRTPAQRDGGIDLRGLWSMEGLIHVRVAVQVKQHASNISRPDIQKLRGSLAIGELGWFFTTGDYSENAKLEAAAPDRQPISLISGIQVASLLLKYSTPLVGEEL